MALYIFIGIVVFYLLVSFAFIPFQYPYIASLKEEEEKRKTQGEMYDKMATERQELNTNTQGNPLFFLANILSSIIYRIKNLKK